MRLRPTLPIALLPCTAAILCGCVDLAPHYRRPALPVAASWSDRTADLPGTMPASTASALAWDRFVADDRLRAIVAVALANNRDLRVAALDVQRARALYRVQDAAAQPALSATADVVRSRADGAVASGHAASLQASYEIDLFGRLRNLDAAALATYFATDEARRGAQVLLVSEVATAWLTLAADRQRLALSRQTLDSQQRSLDLAVRMRALGASNGLAVAQARSTVEAVRIQVATAVTQVGLDRNALELLVGAPLDDALLPDGPLPPQAAVLFDVPDDLPSSVLVERPDVRAAERGLEATFANIGAARAAYFPRITLTGAGGVASPAFSGLLRGAAFFASIGPSLTVPLLDGGLNDANLAVARSDRDIALANYGKSLQTAFREVADVLVVRGTLLERTAGQRAFVDALETSFRLSDAVFRQGGTSYLQVLDAQRSLYGAQQGLISLQLEEQTTRVALYKALGGGWNDGNAR